MYLVNKTRQIHRLIIKIAAGILSSILLFSAPAFSDEVSDWRKQVSRSIAKNHIYPRSAIAREIEGTARVQLVITRAGEVTSFEVVQPSGQSVLDKTIPRLIKRISPLPAPPSSLADADLTFVIPVTWQAK